MTYCERKLIGHVTSVSTDSFFIHITSDPANDYENHEFEIPISLVMEKDKELLCDGSVVEISLWAGGITINFNRDCWTEEEICNAKKRAKNIKHILG